MKIQFLIYAAVLLCFADVAHATHDHDVDDRGVLSPIAHAPAKTRTKKNPFEGQQDAVQGGEKLFRQHCAECHGDDARGKDKAADLRSPGVQNATDGELEWFLRNGNVADGMPSWSGISEQRRWQIIAYLKHLPAIETAK